MDFNALLLQLKLHAFNYTIITYVCFIKFMKQDLCPQDGLAIPFIYKFIPKINDSPRNKQIKLPNVNINVSFDDT